MDIELAKYIDHSLLKPSATTDEIVKLCAEAVEYGFFAVCVNPVHVRRAVKELAATNVTVVTTVAFPLGAELTDIKIAQTQRAVSEGAEEIDFVLNIGALKEGDVPYLTSEIESIVRVAKEHPVKVIIECDLLTNEEKILATELCMNSGAYMVKTSTGFLKEGHGATVEDVQLLKEAIGNGSLKIKASGGIKDHEKAKALIEAGASRLGTSSGVTIIEESRLAAPVC